MRNIFSLAFFGRAFRHKFLSLVRSFGKSGSRQTVSNYIKISTPFEVSTTEREKKRNVQNSDVFRSCSRIEVEREKKGQISNNNDE